MKLKEDFKIRKVGKDYLVISSTLSGVDYTRVLSLNESAYFLLNSTGVKEFLPEDWAEMLSSRYKIDKLQAAADVERLINDLKTAGVLES